MEGSNRILKFRAWDKQYRKMLKVYKINLDTHIISGKWWESPTKQGDYSLTFNQYEVMQYTGLKDKNNLTDIYECDIIDIEGNLRGNIYEMDKGETDFVIQGFGTKDWCETYRRAILLGCKDAE